MWYCSGVIPDIHIAIGDTVLGKYRVERILGKGGMGMVIAARHLELEELFAIKFMLPGTAESPDAAARFLREARAAAKLKGDHVAKVHDVGRMEDGSYYMVMEYLEGSDLGKVLKKFGLLPMREALTYALQACETLKEAHALGIVHRDIKPTNIFLAQGPQGISRVKIIDFGISKYTPKDSVSLTVTSTGSGSPLYMSPEQMRSYKYVDSRTDIWAMGVVLYELLTGTTPFHADTLMAVAGRVLQDEAVPPSHLRPDIPPWLDGLILRCLQKRPEDRFQSVDELMQAMQVSGPLMSRPSLTEYSHSWLPSKSETMPLSVKESASMPASSTTQSFVQSSQMRQALLPGILSSRWLTSIGAAAGIGLGLLAGGALIWGLRDWFRPHPEAELHGLEMFPAAASSSAQGKSSASDSASPVPRSVGIDTAPVDSRPADSAGISAKTPPKKSLSTKASPAQAPLVAIPSAPKPIPPPASMPPTTPPAVAPPSKSPSDSMF